MEEEEVLESQVSEECSAGSKGLPGVFRTFRTRTRVGMSTYHEGRLHAPGLGLGLGFSGPGSNPVLLSLLCAALLSRYAECCVLDCEWTFIANRHHRLASLYPGRMRFWIDEVESFVPDSAISKDIPSGSLPFPWLSFGIARPNT